MDVEKVRELLREIRDRADRRWHIGGDDRVEWAMVIDETKDALRALDGDGAEEWTANTGPHGLYRLNQAAWPVFVKGADRQKLVGVFVTPEDAERAARLPALERESERMVAEMDHYRERCTSIARSDLVAAHEALRAALSAEPGK